MVRSFNRDDSIPTVSVNPSAGNYGTVQNVALTCGDTGGAGCSAVAYTLNGTSPAFNSSCSVTNGILYSAPVPTPDSAVTTITFKSCDQAGNISTLYSQTYTVDSILPSITINSVLPGSTIRGGVSPQITWQSDKDGAYQLKIGANCASGTAAFGTNVSGNATAGVPIASTLNAGGQLADGNRKVLVCVSNLIGNTGSSSTTLLVDSVSPLLSLSPAGGVYASQQTVTANCSDSTSGCQKVAYTTDGSDPTFDVSGNISNGSLYLGSLTTPNNAVTSYKFMARDVAGNTSTIQSVAFTVGSIPPSGLSYSTPSASYTQNVAIASNVPTVSGSGLTYTISPALPTGLVLNASSGVISGTPTAAQSTSSYTVTATNSGGSTNTSITIAIASAVPVHGCDMASAVDWTVHAR
jgi:hypothetical protein